MSKERNLKWANFNVTNAVEQFKRKGGDHADHLIKLLETETKWAPEKGTEVPNRTIAKRIGLALTFPGKKVAGAVEYTFNDKDVIWLMFRGEILP